MRERNTTKPIEFLGGLWRVFNSQIIFMLLVDFVYMGRADRYFVSIFTVASSLTLTQHSILRKNLRLNYNLSIT